MNQNDGVAARWMAMEGPQHPGCVRGCSNDEDGGGRGSGREANPFPLETMVLAWQITRWWKKTSMMPFLTQLSHVTDAVR